MQKLASRQLLEFTNETLTHSTEIAELWAGTIYESQIENDRRKVIESLKNDDEDKIRNLVNDLSVFVKEAEKKYHEPENNLL